MERDGGDAWWDGAGAGGGDGGEAGEEEEELDVLSPPLEEFALPPAQDAASAPAAPDDAAYRKYTTVFTNAKAGMAAVDKDHVQRVVFEASKDSECAHNNTTRAAHAQNTLTRHAHGWPPPPRRRRAASSSGSSGWTRLVCATTTWSS